MKYTVYIHENSQRRKKKLDFSAPGKGIVLKEDEEKHSSWAPRDELHSRLGLLHSKTTPVCPSLNTAMIDSFDSK